ncbi:hypothetical protein [Oceaniovalibus sp. ACAM 378]|jgi:hypothetical protein|uniref:hypothetical protein n=1 Tax=Oceaniovalibus sp. ACAM 378 TaxID=2599923 RepID=UPI0011D40C02|nr:hypothetical protein [Oceaniovalibus sp. ACAM 378]TYB84418.1 hypothetical protein FQ320_22010 [Oceaniovalibus sp. ACAM 378]
MIKHASRTCATALTMTVLAAVPGWAQDDPAPRGEHVTLLGIPSGTVAPGGLAFVSLAGTTNRVDAPDTQDGSLAFGLGFGSAEDGIGVQFTTQITSLTDDFGDSGYLALKFSRRVVASDNPVYLGLSLDYLTPWGDVDGRDPEAALSLTKFTRLQFSETTSLPVMFTLGAGTGVRNNDTDPGIFFGAGIGLNENLGVSAAWSGEYADIGASFRFDGVDNLGISATVHDVFDQKDNRRLTVAVNYFLQDLF